MDWFRPAVSSILLLGLTLGLFFATPLLRPAGDAVAAAGPAAVAAWTAARVLVLLAAAFLLARASARAPAAGLVVAAPAVLVGGLMGVAAALRPVHLLVVAGLAAGVVAACLLGAGREARG